MLELIYWDVRFKRLRFPMRSMFLLSQHRILPSRFTCLLPYLETQSSTTFLPLEISCHACNDPLFLCSSRPRQLHQAYTMRRASACDKVPCRWSRLSLYNRFLSSSTMRRGQWSHDVLAIQQSVLQSDTCAHQKRQRRSHSSLIISALRKCVRESEWCRSIFIENRGIAAGWYGMDMSEFLQRTDL